MPSTVVFIFIGVCVVAAIATAYYFWTSKTSTQASSTTTAPAAAAAAAASATTAPGDTTPPTTTQVTTQATLDQPNVSQPTLTQPTLTQPTLTQTTPFTAVPVTAGPTTTAAPWIPLTTYRQADKPDYCLTHAGSGNYGIKSTPCQPGSLAQFWYDDPKDTRMRPATDPQVCMTYQGKAAIGALACNGSAAQKWSLTPAGALVSAQDPAASLQVGSGGATPNYLNMWSPIGSGPGSLWKKQA